MKSLSISQLLAKRIQKKHWCFTRAVDASGAPRAQRLWPKQICLSGDYCAKAEHAGLVLLVLGVGSAVVWVVVFAPWWVSKFRGYFRGEKETLYFKVVSSPVSFVFRDRLQSLLYWVPVWKSVVWKGGLEGYCPATPSEP